jgi:hypothetical protein
MKLSNYLTAIICIAVVVIGLPIAFSIRFCIAAVAMLTIWITQQRSSQKIELAKIKINTPA